MKQTKKTACVRAWFELVKHYEDCAFSTFYRGSYKLSNGNWHYCGKYHDYTF